MNNETIFITQIASSLSFFIALFVLYRVLVSNKDSTIELQKEKISLLQLQLDESKQQSPDILVENITKRTKLLTEELELLNKDKDTNERVIEKKEEQLSALHEKLQDLQKQIEKASEFFCPHCKAPMVYREFSSEWVEYKGREFDIDHESVLFECGLEYLDGEEGTKCGSL